METVGKLDGTDIIHLVRKNVVGKDAVFTGPFGEKRVIYCDYTASAKPVEFIENYISEYVSPFYANTHTTTSISALQTGKFRENARDIIKKSVNANEDDAVIFCGNGVTAAVHKTIHALHMTAEKAANTVILGGPNEHHSNILPWKETGASTDTVREGDNGLIDLNDLEEKLQTHSRAGRNIIVAMSAASNVTGIIADTDGVSELAHKYDALAIWDYATAAPYIKIDMNTPGLKYKDAIFCSPHKFVGGVGTPGVLIAKKKLFQNPIPGNAGGGTVLYVTKHGHKYHPDIETREEGGTPGIVESIRAGLVFSLKDAISEKVIEAKEDEFCKRALERWSKNANISILGHPRALRLPIFSLIISHPESCKYLHHNFVSVLLNDLYGIQVRGGCACAEPYAQNLLSFLVKEPGDGEEKVKLEIQKVGFARLNFPYFLDDETVEFILNAVDRVATDGWKMLPQYCCNLKTAEWHHRDTGQVTVRTLENIDFTKGGLVNKGSVKKLKRKGNLSLETVAEEVEKTLSEAIEIAEWVNFSKDPKLDISEKQRKCIWSLQPHEALSYLRLLSNSDHPIHSTNIAIKETKRKRSHLANGSIPTEAGNEDNVEHNSNFHQDCQVCVSLAEDPSANGSAMQKPEQVCPMQLVKVKPSTKLMKNNNVRTAQNGYAVPVRTVKDNKADTSPKIVQQNGGIGSSDAAVYIQMSDEKKVFRQIPITQEKKLHRKQKCNIL